jgi:nucleoside-diphosphate-sugar epimerase
MPLDRDGAQRRCDRGWGDGKQTRSFLYIDECLEGTTRLLRSCYTGPVNIGSEEMVSIDRLVDMIADIAGKRIEKQHVDGPQGVRGRNSDNRQIEDHLGWAPSQSLRFAPLVVEWTLLR